MTSTCVEVHGLYTKIGGGGEVKVLSYGKRFVYSTHATNPLLAMVIKKCMKAKGKLTIVESKLGPLRL